MTAGQVGLIFLACMAVAFASSLIAAATFEAIDRITTALADRSTRKWQAEWLARRRESPRPTVLPTDQAGDTAARTFGFCSACGASHFRPDESGPFVDPFKRNAHLRVRPNQDVTAARQCEREDTTTTAITAVDVEGQLELLGDLGRVALADVEVEGVAGVVESNAHSSSLPVGHTAGSAAGVVGAPGLAGPGADAPTVGEPTATPAPLPPVGGAVDLKQYVLDDQAERLICSRCDAALCDIDPGDTLDVLINIAAAHHCGDWS